MAVQQWARGLLVNYARNAQKAGEPDAVAAAVVVVVDVYLLIYYDVIRWI